MLRPSMFVLLPVLMLFSFEAVAAETVVSVEDLPRLIKERNGKVQAAEAQLKASQARSGHLARSFLPHVSGSLGTEAFKTGSSPLERQNYWSLEGRINLYRGGRDRLENEIAKTVERRSKLEYHIEANDEVKEARQTFWRLVAISKQIADRKEALEKNESYIRSSKRRTGAGISTNADTLQFELYKTLLSQEIKHMSHEEDVLKSKLAVAIGAEDHEKLRISGDFSHPPESVSILSPEPKEVLEIQKLESIHSVESLRKSQASRWWVPHLDLYSKYGVPSLDDEYATALRQDTEFSVGLLLSVDFGSDLQNRKEAVAKGYEAQASLLRAAHRRNEVQAVDHELRHDMKLLHELIHDADQDIKKAKKFLALTQAEYSRGVKNGPDLLAASERLHQFRDRRTSLYREYHEAEAELLALTAKVD